MVNKLILFITEACNFRCGYCYEGCGMRPTKAGIMRPSAARLITRRMMERFGACNFIQFFGGEPTLNLPAIRAVVDEIEIMTSERALAVRPQMGIVTNGSLRNPAEFIAFCESSQISVTVSLDGPPPIHDALRPDARGRATTTRRFRSSALSFPRG